MSDYLELPCLGRKVELGMLYDFQNELFVPDVKLWEKDVLLRVTENKFVYGHINNVTVVNSLDTTLKLLKVDENTALSFIAGIIPVKGGAEYLNSELPLQDEVRVVLEYHYTQKVKLLSDVQLKSLKVNQLHSCVAATHVVTSVEYGTDGYFVFHQKLSKFENSEEVERSLVLIIKKCISQHEKTSEMEKEQVRKLTCTYYGDISLSCKSLAFEKAITDFKTLSLKEKITSLVPIRFSVLPLSKLDLTASGIQIKPYFPISSHAACRCIQLFEQCKNVLSKASTQEQNPIYEHLQGLRFQLQKFIANVSKIQSTLRSILINYLPIIRGGECEEEELLKEVETYSPFENNRLQCWITAKVKEGNILESVFNKCKENIPNLIIKDNLQLLSESTKILGFSVGKDVATCEHKFLVEMDSFFNGIGTNELVPWTEEDEWYSDNHVVEHAVMQLSYFVEFARVNIRCSDVKFAIITETDKKWKRLSKNFGSILLYSNFTWQIFQPPSPPRNVQLVAADCEQLNICWESPLYGMKFVTHYTIEYHRCEFAEELKTVRTEGKEMSIYLNNLTHNSCYTVKVSAICEAGSSESSGSITQMKTKPPPPLISIFKDKCKLLKQQNGKNWLQIPTNLVVNDPKNQIKIFEIGEKPTITQNHDEKVVILMGGVGHGRKTLLNAMVNYIFGVQMDDPFVLQIVLHEETKKSQSYYSQTSDITAYRFYWHKLSKLPYTLVLIDTPVLDVCYDLQWLPDIVLKQLKSFFDLKCIGLVDHLDCVGFVFNSNIARLTPGLRYICQNMLDVFGKNLNENISMFLTFFDGTTPPALSVLREQVPFKRCYKFNNNVFTEFYNCSDSELKWQQWEMAYTGAKMFFDDLKLSNPQSLTLTCENLQVRMHLEVVIQSLQQHVQAGVDVLACMKQELPQIKMYVAEIKANKEFHRKIQVPKVRRKIMPPGKFVTYCLGCSTICHFDCEFLDPAEIYKCSAMALPRDENTHCEVCIKKCTWRFHNNTPYYFEDYIAEEVVTIKVLKEKYDKAKHGLNEMGELLMRFTNRFDEVQQQILADVENIKQLLQKLNEVALKHNPFTVIEYIQNVIIQIKLERRPGWELKVEQLEAAKKRSEMKAELGSLQPYDPFKDIKENILKECSDAIDEYKSVNQSSAF